MTRALSKFIAPLARRIRLLSSRGTVAVVDDAQGEQALQVGLLAGETRDNVPRPQQYGFTSVPLPGAEAIYLSLGGDRDNGIVIVASDRRYRVQGLEAGEVAIYTDEGDKITFKRGRNIEIETMTLTIKAPTGVRMETALLAVTGEVKDLCDTPAARTMSAMRDIYDNHDHDENDNGGPTDKPNQRMDE
jgi:phage baseplate assembly protein V